MNPDCDATRVAALLAAAPTAFGGVHLRRVPHDPRSRWLEQLRSDTASTVPWVYVPASTSADALYGGIDLPATLATGRPQLRQGLMARAHGGFLVLTLTGRIDPRVLAAVRQTLDEGLVRIEREGVAQVADARFGLILLDDGEAGGQDMPVGLLDHLAFTLDAQALETWDSDADRPVRVRAQLEREAALLDARPAAQPPVTAAARPAAASGSNVRLAPHQVSATAGVSDQDLHALCASAWQLGILSLRAPIQALQVAAQWARLQGRSVPDHEDLVTAGALVFAARARRLPPGDDLPSEAPPEAGPTEPQEPPESREPESGGPEPTDAPPPPVEDSAADQQPAPPEVLAPPPQTPDGANERAVEEVLSALPDDLLLRLTTAAAGQSSGRASAMAVRRQGPARHGRPVGSKRGDPRQGMPLDFLATVHAALPWQRLRSAPVASSARVSIRASDLQVRRLKPRTRSTVVFAVDASGSAALHRLNEAKGAVASLLGQCYVRRDQVALISFRGGGAALKLPPTRSLARVHRELSSLAGGGGTPLASGLEMATQLGEDLRRRGDAPLLVLLTDGRANVSRDGIGGRVRAEQEAYVAAASLRASGLPVLLVDISLQPQERARLLARAMGAEYLPLPQASAERLADAVAERMPAGRVAQRA